MEIGKEQYTPREMFSARIKMNNERNASSRIIFETNNFYERFAENYSKIAQEQPLYVHPISAEEIKRQYLGFVKHVARSIRINGFVWIKGVGCIKNNKDTPRLARINKSKITINKKLPIWLNIGTIQKHSLDMLNQKF